MRNSNGRLAPGNTFGQGRPTRQTEEQYLIAFSEALSIPQWKKMVKRAVKDAAVGDHRARGWLGKYTLGASPLFTLNQYEKELMTLVVNWDGATKVKPTT